MTNGSTEVRRSFPRNVDALGSLFSFVGDFFDQEKIDDRHRFAIDFALEEIFTNLVKYNPGQGDVEIRLSRTGDEIKLSITDFETNAFDINDVPPVDTSLPIEQRVPGGLGVHLVRQMIDRVEFARDEGAGTITLYKTME